MYPNKTSTKLIELHVFEQKNSIEINKLVYKAEQPHLSDRIIGKITVYFAA